MKPGTNLPGCDTRPRIFITPNRDGTTVNWASHPAAKGTWAATAGAAVEAGLAAIGGVAAVIIYGE